MFYRVGKWLNIFNGVERVLMKERVKYHHVFSGEEKG